MVHPNQNGSSRGHIPPGLYLWGKYWNSKSTRSTTLILAEKIGMGAGTNQNGSSGDWLCTTYTNRCLAPIPSSHSPTKQQLPTVDRYCRGSLTSFEVSRAYVILTVMFPSFITHTSHILRRDILVRTPTISARAVYHQIY